MNDERPREALSRRNFLKTSAAAAGISILQPRRVFGSQANSMVNVGIVGTGGRGRLSGRNLLKTGRARVVALADYFDFQTEEPAREFDVDRSRCFSGLDGYKGVLALEEVDAVALTGPPYCRPQQFEDALRAGKHVFAEKPIAVDVRGCRRFLDAGKDAGRSKLTVVAGLQSRYDEGARKMAKLIQGGAIGRPLVGHSQRMGGDLWRRERPSHFTELDHQIRHWLYYLWAGGDFIVEMHVHNLDRLNWCIGMLPVSATGSGGRDVRKDVGDIYDHINVLYEYPNGFHLSHTGTQIQAGFRGQESRIVGTDGFYDSAEGIQTKDGQKIGVERSPRNAAEEEMVQFVASIFGEGPYRNNSEYVTTSTFTTILGRAAAYRGTKVTWKELWDSDERIEMPAKGP